MLCAAGGASHDRDDEAGSVFHGRADTLDALAHEPRRVHARRPGSHLRRELPRPVRRREAAGLRQRSLLVIKELAQWYALRSERTRTLQP